MLPLLPIFLLLGLFLPGFFIARLWRDNLPGPSAFVISLPILFHSIFWLGVFHVSITLWSVLPILLAVTAAAAWAQRRLAAPVAAVPTPPWTRPERILLASTGLVALVLVVYSGNSPLMGSDAPFRWDFLAQRILSTGKFSFYPPLTPADFRSYFFVDGIPPMVSFTNWWLYASAGRYLPVLICVFVAAQFVCALAFTYGAAAALFSRRAGVVAAAILASSPLFFRAVVLGQETGLTALAIAAMFYFLVTARESREIPAMVSAGLAAGLCALSREYGWIALVASVIALLWRRQPWKQVVVFGGVTAVVAGPWYVRNWVVAGNPFYSLRFAGFAVNPIHDSILQFYKATLGVGRWSASNWVSVSLLILTLALFPTLAGIPGGVKHFRRHGYLLAGALLVVAVWILSIGYTSGGVEISTRVLSPALVLLSIAGGGMLEPLWGRARWGMAMLIALVACQLWNAAQGMYFPNSPLSIGSGQWVQSAFPRILGPAEFQMRDQLVKLLPPGRVLTDSAYLHAALVDSSVEVVPVWSPEVRFLFSSPPEEAERQLQALHIASIVCYPQTLNMAYLVSASPLYGALPERWKAVAQSAGTMFILVPKNP
jgi:hypothetical protein